MIHWPLNLHRCNLHHCCIVYLQHQQRQHYSCQVPDIGASHIIPGVQYPTDSNYFLPAAPAPSIPKLNVPLTNGRIHPVQCPSSGMHPIVNVPPAAEPFVVAQPAHHSNPLLPGQVNMATPTVVSTTPGMFFCICA